jgi:hypothetical protein
VPVLGRHAGCDFEASASFDEGLACPCPHRV